MEFIAYIDEAGDEGFGKLRDPANAGGQSRWLLIGACLVLAENDPKVPQWRDGVIERLQKPWKHLHFCDLSHDQRVVVSQEISKLPLGAALTFSHKVTIPGTKFAEVFAKKGYLYNYLLRWLLERLTSEVAAADPNGRLRLVFSKRGGTNYRSMRDYLILMRDGRELLKPVRSINWKVLDVDDIEVENHSKRAGLQLADCITSAFYAAVEPNRYGNYEPRYADQLRPRVIHKGGNALNHGIAPVPSFSGCRADEAQMAFFRSFTKVSG